MVVGAVVEGAGLALTTWISADLSGSWRAEPTVDEQASPLKRTTWPVAPAATVTCEPAARFSRFEPRTRVT